MTFVGKRPRSLPFPFNWDSPFAQIAHVVHEAVDQNTTSSPVDTLHIRVVEDVACPYIAFVDAGSGLQRPHLLARLLPKSLLLTAANSVAKGVAILTRTDNASRAVIVVPPDRRNPNSFFSSLPTLVECDPDAPVSENLSIVLSCTPWPNLQALRVAFRHLPARTGTFIALFHLHQHINLDLHSDPYDIRLQPPSDAPKSPPPHSTSLRALLRLLYLNPGAPTLHLRGRPVRARMPRDELAAPLDFNIRPWPSAGRGIARIGAGLHPGTALLYARGRFHHAFPVPSQLSAVIEADFLYVTPSGPHDSYHAILRALRNALDSAAAVLWDRFHRSPERLARFIRENPAVRRSRCDYCLDWAALANNTADPSNSQVWSCSAKCASRLADSKRTAIGRRGRLGRGPGSSGRPQKRRRALPATPVTSVSPAGSSLPEFEVMVSSPLRACISDERDPTQDSLAVFSTHDLLSPKPIHFSPGVRAQPTAQASTSPAPAPCIDLDGPTPELIVSNDGPLCPDDFDLSSPPNVAPLHLNSAHTRKNITIMPDMPVIRSERPSMSNPFPSCPSRDITPATPDAATREELMERLIPQESCEIFSGVSTVTNKPKNTDFPHRLQPPLDRGAATGDTGDKVAYLSRLIEIPRNVRDSNEPVETAKNANNSLLVPVPPNNHMDVSPQLDFEPGDLSASRDVAPFPAPFALLPPPLNEQETDLEMTSSPTENGSTQTGADTQHSTPPTSLSKGPPPDPRLPLLSEEVDVPPANDTPGSGESTNLPKGDINENAVNEISSWLTLNKIVKMDKNSISEEVMLALSSAFAAGTVAAASVKPVRKEVSDSGVTSEGDDTLDIVSDAKCVSSVPVGSDVTQSEMKYKRKFTELVSQLLPDSMAAKILMEESSEDLDVASLSQEICDNWKKKGQQTAEGMRQEEIENMQLEERKVSESLRNIRSMLRIFAHQVVGHADMTDDEDAVDAWFKQYLNMLDAVPQT